MSTFQKCISNRHFFEIEHLHHNSNQYCFSCITSPGLFLHVNHPNTQISFSSTFSSPEYSSLIPSFHSFSDGHSHQVSPLPPNTGSLKETLSHPKYLIFCPILGNYGDKNRKLVVFQPLNQQAVSSRGK